MPTSAQVPDPGLPAGLGQDGTAPATADGQPKPPVKKKSRWADAVEPLPAVLNQLEKHALTVTILLFTFVALKAIVMSRGDIPAALGIFQATNPAVTVIGALLSALPLAAVAVLVIIGYRAVKEASSQGLCAGAGRSARMFLRDTLANLDCQPGRWSGCRVCHEATAEAGNAARSCALHCGFLVYRVSDNVQSPV